MSGGIKSGAAGCMLLLTASIMGIIALFLTGFALVGLTVTSNIILIVGILLVSSGAMKLGKYYENPLPKVAGIIGFIAGIIGLVSTIIWLVGILVLIGLFGVAGIMLFVTAILLGVFFILLGISFIVLMNKLESRGLSVVTGVFTLLAGIFTFVGGFHLVLAIIYTVMLILAAIFAAIVFLRVKGIPTEAPKEAKKLAVKAVEAKPKKQKPADVEAEVYKYVKSHPSGIDVADCAESLGVSEGEVQKSINALVKKGKLELG